MQSWYHRSQLTFLYPILFLLLLSACDPGVTLHLVRRDMQPLTCPDNAEMSYSVVIQYRDGERYDDTFDVDKRINHPTIGMLAGGIERQVSWVQFTLYCGESKTPVLITPQIVLPNDLVKKDDKNYVYYVD